MFAFLLLLVLEQGQVCLLVNWICDFISLEAVNALSVGFGLEGPREWSLSFRSGLGNPGSES